MSDVTQILQQIKSGDPSAADQLLPLVFNELRKLTAARMAHDQAQHRDSRSHFFAAAEAMRRIRVGGAGNLRRTIIALSDRQLRAIIVIARSQTNGSGSTMETNDSAGLRQAVLEG